jgi:hypothetical protein
MRNRNARNPDVPGLERERPVAGRKDPDAGTDIRADLTHGDRERVTVGLESRAMKAPEVSQVGL